MSTIFITETEEMFKCLGSLQSYKKKAYLNS